MALAHIAEGSSTHDAAVRVGVAHAADSDKFLVRGDAENVLKETNEINIATAEAIAKACVDEAVKEGYADPDRLGVGGWSYGGILTDYTIASTTRFKAATSGAGVGNPIMLYGVDQYIHQYDNELQPPWKAQETYVKLAYPLYHADRIKTPTLFMGGDKDFNVPLVGGEQMYEALRSLNVPTELVVYPGQFHGFTRPSFIRDRYQRWFDWYDKWVLGKMPAPPPAAAPATPAKELGSAKTKRAPTPGRG